MLQLYILGTEYPQYKGSFQLIDLILGDILNPSGSNAQLAKQVNYEKKKILQNSDFFLQNYKIN